MSVYEGNDLRDLLRNESFRVDPQTAARGQPDSDSDADSWLNVSYAASFLRASFLVLRERIRGFEEPTDLEKIDFRYSARSEGRTLYMNVTNADNDEVVHARLLSRGEISMNVFERPLRDFAALARTNGFVPMVSYLPSMYSAYADTVVFNDPVVGRDVVQLGSLQRGWLRKACADLGLVFVDITAALRQSAASGPLTHFPSNVHLTAYGHQVVARELLAAIRQLPEAARR
jgi:hypothetical protein